MWRCNKTYIAPDESIFILCQFNMLQNIEWRGTKERSYRNCIHGHDDWILLIHTRCSMKSKLYAFNDFFCSPSFFSFFLFFGLLFVWWNANKLRSDWAINWCWRQIIHHSFELHLKQTQKNCCTDQITIVAQGSKTLVVTLFSSFFSVHIQYFPFIVVFLLWKTKDLFLLFSSFFSVNKKKHNRRAN